MVVSSNWIVLLALTCTSWAFSTAEAAPAKSIKFNPETGALDPPGAVPFDQWITAISSTPIKVSDGKELPPTADFEFCGASLKGCPLSFDQLKPCTEVRLPIRESCSLPLTRTPAADGKGGFTVRVDIPPLRYNRAYQLSIADKETILKTSDFLQKVDSSVDAKIQQSAASKSPPTAADICKSVADAIRSQFKNGKVKIEGPLSSCASETASTEQIEPMRQRIDGAIRSRNVLTLAEQNSEEPPEDLNTKRVRDANAQEALSSEVRQLVSASNIRVRIPFGTAADAATTRMSYISLDAGLAYGWDLDESTTYLGANIYFRPINTDVSLASLRAQRLLKRRHQFSLTLGTTLESIEKPGQRKGFIGSNALVVGVGWRLTDVIRISAGVLVFEEENPNPLVTNDTSLTVSPYVGFSFDVDVAKQIGKVFPTLP